MRLSRLVTSALAFVVVAGIAAGAIYVFNNRPIAVQVAVPEKNVALQVFGLGSVEARVISNVGFEVAGILDALQVDHGDSVKRGDVLARLDTAEQQARVVRAEASVQSSEAALNRTQTMVERQAAVLAQKEETNRRQQELLRKGVAAVEKAAGCRQGPEGCARPTLPSPRPTAPWRRPPWQRREPICCARMCCLESMPCLQRTTR